MSLDITPGDGIVGELELLGDLIVGGFPEAVFTLPGVSVDEVLDHARLYLGFAEAAQAAHARVRELEIPEFVGVEGEFFRGRVPGELAMQLGAAVESYSRVGSGIKELARELDASQVALKPLEARARAVFEHMQKVWVKVNVPFTEYSGLRSEWDQLVHAAGLVHERVAVAGQQAAAQINAGTEAMVPVNDYFSTLPGGAVAGGVVARGVRSTAARAVSATGGVTGAPGRAVKAGVDGLGAAAGTVTSIPQQITARGQQLAAQVTPDGIRVGDKILTDPTSEQAQKLVRDGLATNVLGIDPMGVPTAMMMLASPSTLVREQSRKKAAGRRWSGEESKAQSIAESAVGQVVSVPGRFVGGAVDRFGNTIAGNAALIGVGGDPVRAWTGLLSNVTSPVAGAGRAVASATPEQILADPIAAAGSAATHAPAAVPFVGWAYGLVEWATKPGELAREGAKETLTSALDTLTVKNLEAGQAVANTGEVHVTTSDVDVHADNGGYVTFTLPDLEGGEPKAWYILATPESPGNFTTNVPTQPDEELVERGDGSVVLVNTGTGQIVRTIKTPWAKDALGRDQPTWYSVERLDDSTSTITQHIAPNKGALYPLVADAVQTVPGGGEMTSGNAAPSSRDTETPSNLPETSTGHANQNQNPGTSSSSSGAGPSTDSGSNPPPARTAPVAPPPPPPPPPADPSSPGDDRSQGDIGPREDPGGGRIDDGSGAFDGGAHIDDGSGPVVPPADGGFGVGGSGGGAGAGNGFLIPDKKGIDDGFIDLVDGFNQDDESMLKTMDYVIGADKLSGTLAGPQPPDGVEVVMRDDGSYYWPQLNPDGTTTIVIVDKDGNVHEQKLPGYFTAAQLKDIFKNGPVTVTEEMVAGAQINAWTAGQRQKVYDEQVKPAKTEYDRWQALLADAKERANPVAVKEAQKFLDAAAAKLLKSLDAYAAIPYIDLASISKLKPGNPNYDPTGQYRANTLDLNGQPKKRADGTVLETRITRGPDGKLTVSKPDGTGWDVSTVSPTGSQPERRLDDGVVIDKSADTTMLILDVVGGVTGIPAAIRLTTAVGRMAAEGLAARGLARAGGAGIEGTLQKPVTSEVGSVAARQADPTDITPTSIKPVDTTPTGPTAGAVPKPAINPEPITTPAPAASIGRTSADDVAAGLDRAGTPDLPTSPTGIGTTATGAASELTEQAIVRGFGPRTTTALPEQTGAGTESAATLTGRGFGPRPAGGMDDAARSIADDLPTPAGSGSAADDIAETAADGKPRAFDADGTITNPGAYNLTEPDTWNPIRFFSKDTYYALPEKLRATHAGNRFENVTNQFYKDRGIYSQVFLEKRGPNGGHLRLDSYLPGKVIGSQKLTQAADNPQYFIKSVDEFADKYTPGNSIAQVPTSVNRELEGQLRGRQVLILPPQRSDIPEKLLEYAADQRVYVMDITGKVYNQALMPSALPKEIVDALTVARKP